jgi:ATP-binding cassette subfamily F protein 3
MALSPVAPFSGGEKSRLVLAMLVYQRPNLLLLDEPTNHLDLEMRQALATALQDFTGAMIIVSHDRHLLRVTCDQLLLVHDHCVSEFPFSMDEYPKWLSEQNKIAKNPTEGATAIEAPDANNASAKKDKKRQQAELRKKLQPLSNKVKKAETELDKLHAKQNELEQQLADTDIYNEHNKEKLQACLLKKADLDQRCEAVESQWLEITEELEALSSRR